MVWQWSLNEILLILVAAILTLFALKIYLPGRAWMAKTGTLLLLAGAQWNLFQALKVGSVGLPTKLFLDKLQFLGIVVLPTAWLIFALLYTGRDKWVTHRTVAILSIMPLITLLMVFTNEAHGLIWNNNLLILDGSMAVLDHTFGLGMWAFVVYSYILFFLGIALFIQMLMRSRLVFRWQISGLLFAALIVGLASFIGFSHLTSYKAFEITPLAFAIVAVPVAMSFTRLQRIDIMRVARETISENMVDGVMVLDAQNRVMDLNPAMQLVIGCTPSGVIGQPVDRVWPEGVDQMELSSDRSGVRKELTLGNGEGKCTYDVRVSPLIDWRGRIYGRIVVLCNITERKQAEEALRESEERYRTAIDSSHDGVAIVRGDEYLFVNKKFMEIFGYDRPEEILGKPLSLVAHPDDFKRVEEISLRRQNGELVPLHDEFKGVRKDGTSIDIEVSATHTHYRGEAVFLVYVRDITERKRTEQEMTALEEQLLYSRKMEAIGLLAGGYAHDFNNLLMLIFGNVELGLMRVEQSHPLYDIFTKIQETVRKASALAVKLLAFGRGQVHQPKVLDVAKLIGNLSEMFDRIIGEGIELKMEFGPNLSPVYADPGSLEQVLMNLTVNARDAMPQGGVLTIQAQNIHLDEKFCSLYPYVKPGDYVKISFTDTGVGMDEGILRRSFDPFFTTKEHGTGLGLAVVYGIVKQHKGYIIASSQSGQGARFDIYLPLQQGSAIQESSKVVRKSILRGTETLLVAEDENEVRELFGAFLEELGYKVFLASDGEEALETFSAHHQAIDLVILDVLLPKLSGPKVYDQMRSLRPNLPCLFFTGYSEEIVRRHFDQNSEIQVLRKPITFEELGRKVREVLDQTNRPPQ
jgi:PAS domain S-box-containing protein